MNDVMPDKEAYEIVYQLSRMAQVNADIGDKRDEALSVLKKLVDKTEDK